MRFVKVHIQCNQLTKLMGYQVLIKPSKDWQWNFCHDKNRLLMDLGEGMVFVSAFKQSELVNDAFTSSRFSIEQNEDFTAFMEKLDGQLPLPDEFIYQIVLNAVAAKSYYKPLMPKSWFFDTALSVSSAQVGKVVKLQSKVETRHYLIVESSPTASTLLLIESAHQLNENKTLSQFGLIKVMNDRLMPVKFNSDKKVHAA